MTENEIYRHNLAILNNLYYIDIKSIRALRTGDTERLEQLELEAQTLREQLIK